METQERFGPLWSPSTPVLHCLATGEPQSIPWLSEAAPENTGCMSGGAFGMWHRVCESLVLVRTPSMIAVLSSLKILWGSTIKMERTAYPLSGDTLLE